MPTYTIAGYFENGPGSTITAYKATQFGDSTPAYNTPFPGAPDAGPIFNGFNYGGPTSFLLNTIPTVEDYWVASEYLGNIYWQFFPAGTIGGQGSGGGTNPYAGSSPQNPNWLAPVAGVLLAMSAYEITIDAATYLSNGEGGPGDTIVQNTPSDGTLAVSAFDYDPSVGDRVVYASLDSNRNWVGVYVVTALGDGDTIPWVLTRAADCDTPDVLGSFWAVNVEQGEYLGNGYSGPGMVRVAEQPPNPFVVGESWLWIDVAAGGSIAAGIATSFTSGAIAIGIGSIAAEFFGLPIVVNRQPLGVTPGPNGYVITASDGTWTSAAPTGGGTQGYQGSQGYQGASGGGGGDLDVTVDSGPVVSSGLLPLAITKLPVVPASGILQPLPPLVGRTFSGKSLTYPIEGADPQWICVGRDGNLWVTDGNNGVWQVTPLGVATQFGVDQIIPGLSYICSGPDDNLWTTSPEMIWQITTAGVVTGFSIASTSPYGICAGPDGNLWVAGNDSTITQVDTSGTTLNVITLPNSPGNPVLQGICSGPDGNLWAADGNNGVIWRVTTAGVATAFPVEGAVPFGICVGQDGNLWFVDANSDPLSVWRMTPTGTATQFLIEGAISGSAHGITAGAGGDLWVGGLDGHLYLITVNGVATTFNDGFGETGFQGICSGPDGSLWLADESGNVWTFPFTALTGDIQVTSGDLTFPSNTQGPVITDQADGHTYRIVSTAGVLSTQEVT